MGKTDSPNRPMMPAVGFAFDVRRKRIAGSLRPAWRKFVGAEARTTAVELSDYPTTLKWSMKPFKNGQLVFISMVRAYVASENDRSGGDAKRLVDAWDNEFKPLDDGTRGHQPNLDLLCHKLGIAAPTAYGWFSEMAFAHGMNVARVNAAIQAPVLAQVAVERAMNVKNGGDERRMLFEIMGMLPKRGPTVAVQQNSVSAPAAAVGDNVARTFEDSQRATAQILRNPLKQVGSGTTRPEDTRVQPSDHPASPRPTDRE